MKKRLITLLVAFVMMFSLIVPAYAAETTEAPAAEDKTGGLDFYSITVNYTKDILVDYVKSTEKGNSSLLFKDENGKNVMADKVVLRAGVNKENDYIGYDKSKVASQSNFYQLDLPSAGINATATYSKFPYEYAYITHIQDGAILKSKTAFSFYGIFAPYDEGDAYVNQNPNVAYNKDGYALDVKEDDKGNNYLIDINEYQVAPDGLWYDSTGNRVELFHDIPIMNYIGEGDKSTEVSCQRAYTDDLMFFSYDFRIDSETGKIKKFEDMKAYYYITKDDLVQFFKDNKDSASPTSPKSIPLTFLDPNSTEEGFNYEEELEKILNKGTDKATELKRGENFRKDYYYIEVFPSTYRVVRDFSTVNDEGKVAVDDSKKMSDDLYSTKDTVFEMEYIARDAVGNRIYSTPIQGTPKLNVEIESISIEFDAMGDQLYTDAAADPQSKNKITVSINDFPQNIELKEQALADKWISQNTFDSYMSKVLATVSGKTTSTEANWDTSSVKDTSYKSTVTSIDLGLSKEVLNSLPLTATIFISFDIETTQADGAYNEEYTPNDASVTNQNAKLWDRPAQQDKPDDTGDEGGLDPMLFVWIGIAAVAVIAIVVILVVVLKKKKK